jgi:hypothetical protein
MGSGNNKKKKRSISSPSSGSASGTASVTIESIELVERTVDNDYGVMSDPEENSSPVPLLGQQHKQEPKSENEQEPKSENEEEQEQEAEPPIEEQHICNSSEPRQAQETTLSSQQQDQSILALTQPQKPQFPASTSLEKLQLKLSTDKNFSKKMTLHTFFSYIILSMELEREYAASHNHNLVTVDNIEKLVKYVIDHHSATDDIKMYLYTLMEVDVVRNIILAVIDFNKDQNTTLDKLLSAEQLEIEMTTLKDELRGEKEGETTGQPSGVMNQSPQTSQLRGGFFKRVRQFFSGCCG